MIPIWQSRGYIPSATASSVDSSTSSVISSLPDRTLPWLLARSKKDKDGNFFFPNEETQKIKESIDDWKKKEAEGEFVPGRMDDALSRALQRKDRPGRVLTAGRSIGITSVWGDPDRSSTARKGKGMDDEEIQALEARVSQRVREQTMEEMNSKIDAMVQERLMAYATQLGIPVPTPSTPVVPSSCQSGGNDPFADLQSQAPCLLAIADVTGPIVVAEGTVHPQDRSHRHTLRRRESEC
ncbi:uncharacterized protein LOC130591203 [Beta vulgaris subsp. vulgaris]|uniref:uncharacterized protein LOC130591203 n=1 Tax=Beta vulgaris subsp. vulgaris TaxID=3555 RepID=UPI0025483F19|nr:uncharacterized protein LOC130591203 [Beta vulgaris subsp. vulgaris]